MNVDRQGMVDVVVYFKPNRLGVQSKYFSVITRQGEVDVEIQAEVVRIPQLQVVNLDPSSKHHKMQNLLFKQRNQD